jgi:hypothetical protein
MVPSTAAVQAKPKYNTLRLRLLEVTARFIKKAPHIRILFASACPDAALLRLLAGSVATGGPRNWGSVLRQTPDLQSPTPDTNEVETRRPAGRHRRTHPYSIRATTGPSG